MTTLKSTFPSSKKTLKVRARAEEAHVYISEQYGNGAGIQVEGPALRDALLEAFPLEEKKPEPERRFKVGDRVVVSAGAPWGAGAGEVVEISTFSGAYRVRRDDGKTGSRLHGWVAYHTFELSPEPEKPKVIDVVPGMVIKGKGGRGTVRVCLPDRRLYNVNVPVVSEWAQGNPSTEGFEVIVDPRTAKALPNPFAPKVGDRVSRVTERRGGVREELSFVVNHIDGDTGFISPINGDAVNPKGWRSSTEPARLVPGTVVRSKSTDWLFLRTVHGYINLQTGVEVCDGAGLERDVRNDLLEVIYLP